MSFCHRDLTCENVLLHDDNETLVEIDGNIPLDIKINSNSNLNVNVSNLRVMLSDFGQTESLSPLHLRPRPSTGMTGTIQYSSPELLLPNDELLNDKDTEEFKEINNSWDERVDLWSSGVILHCMCFGTLPFDFSPEMNTSEIKKKLYSGPKMRYDFNSTEYSKQPRSNGLKNLIHRLLRVNPRDRPTILQCMMECEKVMNFIHRSPIQTPTRIPSQFMPPNLDLGSEMNLDNTKVKTLIRMPPNSPLLHPK